MSLDHREPAIIVLKKLTQRVQNVVDHGRGGDIFEDIKFTYNELAAEVSKDFSRKYTRRTIKYPLGIVKYAIFRMYRDSGLRIPNITYLVVSKITKIASSGASLNLNQTRELIQQKIWRDIYGTTWSPDLVSNIIASIDDGPQLVRSREKQEMINADARYEADALEAAVRAVLANETPGTDT